MPKLLVLNNVTPPLVRLVAGLGNVVQSMPSSCPDIVITHGFDGEHKPGSLHKQFAALDIRTKNLTPPEKTMLFANLQDKFPHPRFDVIFEDRGGDNEHIHIEDNSVLPANRDADRTGGIKA